MQDSDLIKRMSVEIGDFFCVYMPVAKTRFGCRHAKDKYGKDTENVQFVCYCANTDGKPGEKLQILHRDNDALLFNIER